MTDVRSSSGLPMVRTLLPGRESRLFLVAILTPCLVLVVLSLRVLDQERQLELKRRAEEHQRQLTGLSQELLARLERIKVGLAFSPVPATDPLVAAIGTMRSERLVFPWDENGGILSFRQAVAQLRFSALLRQAEREELDRSFADAVVTSQEAIRASPHPPAQAYARLLLARVLKKAGRRQESLSQYELVLESPPGLMDEHGIPLALYAASPLLDAGLRRTELGHIIRTLIEGDEWWSPATLYMLRDLAQKVAASDLDARLAGLIHDREQAESLRRDSTGLLPPAQTAEPVWVSYGDPPWLVGMTPRGQVAESMIAVRLQELTDRMELSKSQIRLAANGPGEPLGQSFPGLRATVPVTTERSEYSQQRLIIFAIAVVLSVTLFAGYLLWRDVRRELRLAEARSQFVAGVSHELKTPLTAIRMFAESMRMDEDLDRHAQIGHLDTILQETDRLNRLVDNVLDFARIEQGRKTYRMQPTSLAEVVDAAAKAMDYPMMQSGFQLRVTVDRSLPPILTDRDALQQAVLNLLSNGMKYSAESREIALDLSRENDAAVIRVVDQGVGIPREEQTRIFERFYRVQSPENERLPGTGLGLTLAAHIIAAHGGTIAVESEPGKGSAFIIRIPLEQET
jgi:signal transduction histidine kinase